MALFAGANIGISGILSQNNRTTLPQYTSINAIADQQSANTSNVGDNDGTAGTLTKNNTGNNEQINNGLNDDIIINENQFQYIKNEYPNAETYANEIRSALINQANENIDANKLAIDHEIQDNLGEELFLDSSTPASSPLNINYETIKNAINNDTINNDKFFNNNIYLDKYTGDGYINWDEAMAIYHTIVGDGNNENAKIYAQLMTGLKNRPENFDNDPYNILLTDGGKQQLYATHDRMQIINDNNNIAQSIINNILQSKQNKNEGIDSIGDIVANNRISIEEIKTIIQNTENYNKVIALQDDANDDYTSWNEAKQEYQTYLNEKNIERENNVGDRIAYNEQDAKKYAMIITGLIEAPNNYDNDPYVILERERQELEEKQNNIQTDNNNTNTTNSSGQNKSGQNNNSQNTNNAKNANLASERVVNKYSFRERFNFSIPIGVNVKINDKVSIEPYWLVGFNVAQANVIQNNNSTRLTKVGFTTGLGTRVLFCKELFFVGLEYRFAHNAFEKTKISSHNINFFIGVRFNFATLANLIK